MATLGRMQAVKQFVEKDSSRPVPTSEFMEFWKACSEEERAQFGSEAAANLGIELSITI